MKILWNTGFGAAVTLVGAVECVETQTWQLEDSSALEWWCRTSATADHKVSSRHKDATRFENDCMNLTRPLEHESPKGNLIESWVRARSFTPPEERLRSG
jgi:hypothetical protein